MRLFPRIVLLLSLLLLAVHAYYSYPWDGQRDRMLNPDLWENPYSYFENYRWIPLGGYEVSPISFRMTLDLDDGLGFGYLIDLHMRYRDGDTAAETELLSIRTTENIYGDDLIGMARRIPQGQKSVPLQGYLLRYQGTELIPRYPDPSTQLWLSFRTGLIPPKYLEFVAPNGQRITVNTNPLFLLREGWGIGILLVSMIALGLYLVFGYPTMLPLLLAPPFLMIGSDYLLWYALLYLCVVGQLVPMRIREVSKAPPFRLLTLDRTTTTFLVLAIMVYLFIYQTPESENWFWRIFMAFLFTAGIALMLWGLLEALSLLYINVRYPARPVGIIVLSNPQVVNILGGRKSFPVFYCDVTMTDREGESIRIERAKIHLIDYTRIARGKPLTIKRYKTDGRGSYIFY